MVHSRYAYANFLDVYKRQELTDLTGQLNLFLHRWEKSYGKDEVETTSAERWQGIILRAYKQTGKTIAVLIDEYDAPLLDSNSDIPRQQQLRNEMRKFFSPLKGLDVYKRQTLSLPVFPKL